MSMKRTKTIKPLQELNNPFNFYYMLKILLLLNGLLQLLSQSQGVNSVQQVATVKTIITDKRITGEWTDGFNKITVEPLPESRILRPTDNKGTKPSLGESKEEVALNSKRYAIIIEQNGLEYVVVGSMTKIGDQLFMDIMSFGINNPRNRDQDGTGQEFNPEYLTTTNIARVSFGSNGSLSLQFLRGDFIKEQVLQGRMLLKHEYEPLYNNFVITASSFELRQFLEKYGHDDRLFEPASILLMKKRS